MNLKGRSNRHSAVGRLVERRKPDLLITQETFKAWRTALDPMLAETFPHRLMKKHFGVFSRWPVSKVRMVAIEGAKRPLVLFDWKHPSGDVTVVCVHATTPRFGSWSQRNHELTALADVAAELPSRTVVLGDLNTSLWDPAFKDLLEPLLIIFYTVPIFDARRRRWCGESVATIIPSKRI